MRTIRATATVLKKIKARAKALRDEEGIPLHAALEAASREAGFENFHAVRSGLIPASAKHPRDRALDAVVAAFQQLRTKPDSVTLFDRYVAACEVAHSLVVGAVDLADTFNILGADGHEERDVLSLICSKGSFDVLPDEDLISGRARRVIVFAAPNELIDVANVAVWDYFGDIETSSMTQAELSLALSACEAMVRAVPDFLDGYATMVEIYRAMDQPRIGLRIGQAALKDYMRRLPSRSMKIPYAWTENRPMYRLSAAVGDAAIECGEFRVAETIMKRLLKHDPNDSSGVRFWSKHFPNG